jgi:Rrf2 family protein
MRITKWGECGILCSIYLAKRFGNGSVGASEIASSQGLDLQYTQQILHRLKKGNVVDTVRGPKGGYRLTRAPDEISLRDILAAAEGSTFQIICDYAPIHPSSDANSACSNQDTCSLHGVWKELQTAIDSILEAKKLSTLLTHEATFAAGDSNLLVQVAKRPLSEPEQLS